MTLYLCTAGTSISTGRGAVGATLAARISAKIAAARLAHGDDPRAFLIDVCAEANGLARSDCGPRDEVELLASDTDDGVACAEAVAGLVRDELGARVTVRRIAGLVVDDARSFRRRGVAALIAHARAAARAHPGDVVFNATGGFKGVVPYLTLLGMFEGVEVHYVFDGSDELIRLPPLPVRFDQRRIARFAPALLALAGKGVMTEADFAALPPGKGFHRDPELALLIEREDGLCSLSAAGAIAVAEIERERAAAPGRSRLFVRNAARNGALFFNDLVQRKLAALIDPELRALPRNCATMARSTDLAICKPLGPSAPRIYYKAMGDEVRIVDIVTHHEHEHVIQTGQRRIWWADHANDRYDEIAPEVEPDVLGEALADFLDELAEAGDDARQRAHRAEAEARELRAARDRRERRDADGALPYAAAAWAAQAFAGRLRKDAAGSPYVNHLIEVVALLAEAGVDDPTTLAAGWLHDAIEDVGATHADLARRFGTRVADIVAEVSDDKSLDKQRRKDVQIERAATKSNAARLVALADKVANLRDLDRAPPPDWDHARRVAYFDWSAQVAEAMGEARSNAERRLFDALAQALEKRPA